MVDDELLAILLEALGGDHDAAQVRAHVAQALDAARRAWPEVDVDEPVFVRHLAAHLPGTGSLTSVATSDLYLAVACASGQPAALATFESTFSADLRAVVRRASASVDLDEVMQGLRESLFVPRDGRAPKIAEYGGRGELRAWLRVVATRAALNAAVRGPKERPVENDQELADAVGDTSSAELVYFRVHYESEMKAVLPLALEALSVRERLYLRQHYLDELTLEDMSRMHGVHPATIKRHLAGARAMLTERIQRLLCERLGLSPSEFNSVLALVRSRFQVTMRRLLPDGG